jgi:hypothetical protein
MRRQRFHWQCVACIRQKCSKRSDKHHEDQDTEGAQYLADPRNFRCSGPLPRMWFRGCDSPATSEVFGRTSSNLSATDQSSTQAD